MKQTLECARARERERERRCIERKGEASVVATHKYTSRAHTHTQDEEQDYVNHEAGIMRSNDLQITGFA